MNHLAHHIYITDFPNHQTLPHSLQVNSLLIPLQLQPFFPYTHNRAFQIPLVN